MMKQNYNSGIKKGGFTFTEVMITLALFMILASVGMGAYFRYYQFSLINNDLGKVTKVLHDARFKAMKNPYHSNYGVHISSNTRELTTFRDSYVPSNPENQAAKLEQLDVLQLNLLPNPGVTADIIFENMTGKTHNSGSFRLGKGEYSQTFNISPQGAFE
jgi:prepilin-type N-terminal cleavage/methylation domain-containing protein